MDLSSPLPECSLHRNKWQKTHQQLSCHSSCCMRFVAVRCWRLGRNELAAVEERPHRWVASQARAGRCWAAMPYKSDTFSGTGTVCKAGPSMPPIRTEKEPQPSKLQRRDGKGVAEGEWHKNPPQGMGILANRT